MSISNLTTANIKTLLTLVEKKEHLAKEIEGINAQLESFGGRTSSSNGNSQTEKPSREARRGRKKRGRPFGSKNKSTSSAVKLPKSPRAAKPAPKKTAPTGKGKARGSVQESVWAALKASGKEGIHINDLAKKVGSTKNSLNVLLYRTRKTNKALKKLDKPGVWGWDG